ncbi:1-deoxypentalenic acid 11-beta-hydroxylase [Symmachiella dynata]|uniref:phytanoyl-CoA dioxygenase family protein n=1 Tax=Symmachiella dynata TaxID=2527995 RepID=UPI001189CC62|nr:phytanoyl-CoA dioxygenase family protein [Symmachiella dynata]QDT46522.1 1-deoxypentalenic acid 11-beta-hydroxylase [Symmachiella dynata]
MSTAMPLTSLGETLDLSAEQFGWFESSAPLIDDPAALRTRLEEEGYLYLPGYLDTDLVTAARERLLGQLNELGMVDRTHPVSAGIAQQPWQGRSCHDLVQENAPLRELLYAGRMMDIYRRLFDTPVRHFDFTWLRAIGPGHGTAPHVDSVYMNRGSQRLLTSWTPLMEITPEIGGLTIMPGSHRLDRLKKHYTGDVDTFCTNQPDRPPQDVHEWIGPLGDGKLSGHPARLQSKLGLPWRTAKRYRPGDVVIFKIFTVHGSLDNHSDRIRLSTDSRYQPADEPADERWIGENPIGHNRSVRKGLIC